MTLKKDQIAGTIFILFAVVLFLNTGSIRVVANMDEPGARAFPYFVEGLLVVCSLGIMFGKTRKEKESEKNREPFLDRVGWIRLGMAIGVMLLYAVALQIIGFIVATPLLTIGFIYTLRSGRKVSLATSILIAVLTTVVVYFGFTKGFNIPLPEGILFSL
ncbi:tripartite tricarboxylate transporter TctB family protein [Caproicibacter sp. BJN0012]|uniref:tripartite tricarboxylate transporter TctB family protein n=1 Tax=Caproicibacter sp. BJN0012 TaxID=3110227 RepID=UPI002E12654E